MWYPQTGMHHAFKFFHQKQKQKSNMPECGCQYYAIFKERRNILENKV